jgi:lantibiotic leader peptide-processing serine protease
MTTTSGIRGWRAGQVCRRLVLVAAAGAASVLASCSDMGPVAPPATRAVLAALPSAPRYLIELPAAGSASAALAAQIRAGGGRIVYSHAGTGIVVVAGLSAKSATALRLRNDVQAVVADVHRMRVTDPAFTRMQVRTVKPSAAHLRSFTSRGATDPRTAEFFGDQWNMTVIQADTAWQITSQGAGEKVFILDTGVDTAQVDLVGRVNTTLSTSFAFATDTDTVPLPFSHDVVSHGSFVSSQIATNSLGIAAVAPQAQLVMVRVLNDSGSGSFFANLEGILYATDNGANVINMSLGGYFDRTSADDMSFVDIFQRVVDYAFQRGILLVAAAGNNAEDFNTATSPTGSYVDSLNAPAGLHHILSVGASGPVDQQNFDDIAVYSNFGNDGVAVFAPGGNVADTLPSDSADAQADLVIGACSSASSLCPGQENQYLIGAGTSFASPIVAGEAAVVQGQSTTVVGQALETCIATSSTEVTHKRPDPDYGFGRVNVFTAVTSGSCK